MKRLANRIADFIDSLPGEKVPFWDWDFAVPLLLLVGVTLLVGIWIIAN